MSFRPRLTAIVSSALTIIGCSGNSSPPDSGSVGGSAPGGGAAALGGSTQAVGGSSQVGGASASGGNTTQPGSATGGGVNSGGTSSSVGGNPTGGQTTSTSGPSTGGAPAAGGNANTGGSKAAGGSTTTGGAIANGGSIATGGNATTGGSKATGTGGLTATGGSVATGGMAPTGGSKATGGNSSTGGSSSTSSGVLIHNDVFWKDTSGTPIYSQGGGVLKVGNTYYWYGVKYNGAVTYAANPNSSNSDTAFVAVTIYSSTDLATWKFENNALTAASLTAAGADPSNWIGRVGAAYNATTKKYVLNGQYGGTPNTAQFFATSNTPNGPFTWNNTQATITNVINNNCGDQSIFNDDDGTAYLICSSLNGRSNLYVAPLRAADYLNVEPATRVFGGAGREGNAMFKYNGRYYLCSSDLHGWNASHSYYISATNILGPYGTEGVIGTTDADFSHVTQTGLFLTVPGTARDSSSSAAIAGATLPATASATTSGCR